MAPMSPTLPPPLGNSSPAPEADSSIIKTEEDEDELIDIGNSSMPPEQRRHLMELESSFRVDTQVGMDSLPNMMDSLRMGDMGPPPLPVGRRSGQRTPVNPTPQPSLTNRRSLGGMSVHNYLASEEAISEPHTTDQRDQQDIMGNSSSAERSSNKIPVFTSPSDEDTDGNMASSPIVSAQARSASRPQSILAPAFDEDAARAERAERASQSEWSERSERSSPRPDEIGLAIERQPSVVSNRSTRSGKYGSLESEGPGPASTGARAIPGAASNFGSMSGSLSSSYRRSGRPKFLKSRQNSQRSSVSSVVMDGDSDGDGASTVTAGEARYALSRSTSLGSIASGVTGMGSGSIFGGDRTVSGTSIGAADRALSRLEEERSRMGSVEPNSDSPDRPVTPGGRAPPQAPTDTVITAHVKNIQIPPTIARDFQSRGLGAPGSPSKRAMAAAVTPGLNRGREMTLKEQTASIDKLQKENFDLKLKVYYLNEKLEKHSDEGVKETLKENIDMKVKLAEALRDRKAMKKKFKELEKENESLRAGAKEKAGEEAEQEEVWVLRERIERYETEIEEFRRKESEREEKMREVHLQAENGMHSEAEFEQLHDLLASETSRREAADADNHRLRDEIYRIRASQLDTPQMSRASNYSHSERDRSQSRTDRGLASQLSQTRRENEDLRRDLSAQTSMLTSRNREKDRLYQQIEDLKMNLRSGGHGSVYDHRTESRLESRDSRAQSVTSDRLLDRSVSRLGNQSATGTHVSAITESEREDFENVNGALRDRISELRLKNQDLEQQLEQAYAELEQRNADWENMVDDMEVANAEVQEMQVERNEALRLREDLEVDFDQLKGEAQEEIDRLEEELEVRVNEIYRLEEEVRMKEDDFRSLQLEMRNVSEVVVRLEDSHDAHQGETRRLEERIREFEGIVRDNEQEMNVLEGSLRESNEKLERMTVQSESAKNEISFLREEQDADKIKIGELEGLIKSLEMTIMEEKDRVREMREKLELERKERGQHGDLKAQEYEKKLNDKNDEVTRTKEEVRTLRGKVAMREQDANQWREKQEEMERGLRQALGDMSSSRAGLMKSVFKLQTELESSLEELDYTKSEMVEKEQILKDRENLLETMALENRKLTSLLDKEKAARRSDKAQLETLQSSQSVTTRRISEHKTQFTEMERQRNRDTRSLQQLENQLREQIAERNKVLLESWTRLSTVCGADWAHRNSLVTITSSTTPGKLSMETSITSAFQGFSRNFLSAVKTIESIVAGFKTKVKSVERDLWKEYQVVENALDSRTRRLDRLEALARGGIGEQSAVRTEVAKLRTENRVLKAELSVIKKGDLAAAATATATASASGSGTSTPTGSAPPTRPAPPQRTRTAIEVASDALQSGGMAVTAAAAGETGEKRWILRLRELEKRLKQEREARLLDRSMAKRKVEEARGEKEEIRKELERERVRGEKY